MYTVNKSRGNVFPVDFLHKSGERTHASNRFLINCSSGLYQVISTDFKHFTYYSLVFNSLSPTVFLGKVDLYVIIREISSRSSQLEF